MDRGALARVAARGGEAAPASSIEPRDEDVLATASAFVPAARRAKFEALYVALSQSPMGRSASPAARAARAVALAGRGGEMITARRARLDRVGCVADRLRRGRPRGGEQATSTGEVAARLVRRAKSCVRSIRCTSRRGQVSQAVRTRGRSARLVCRSEPGNADVRLELLARGGGGASRADRCAGARPHRSPGGRFGGGEVELPAWFEQAARKMLSEQSSVAGDISIAELTLVAAAPPTQIAASTRVAGGSAASSSSAPRATMSDQPAPVDIDKLANDVYREVMLLMDIARARNGEPYL